MGAPVVVAIAASPPPRPELTGALLASCTEAVGDGGCALDDAPRSGSVRARVVVELGDGFARVRVAAVPSANDAADGGPGDGARVARYREIVFRPGDPDVDRFHAVGLVIAWMVEDRAAPSSVPGTAPGSSASDARRASGSRAAPDERPVPADHEAVAGSAPPAPAPSSPPASSPGAPAPDAAHTATGPRVDLRAAALLGWTRVRPWWGALAAADVGPAGAVVYGTGSALYAQTWRASSTGISEQRLALGAGGGARVPLGSEVVLHGRAQVEVNDVRAGVVQPSTGRRDSGDRVLVGLGVDLDVALALPAGLELALGARLDWLGDSTGVSVQDHPVTTIPAWTYGVTAGLALRLR